MEERKLFFAHAVPPVSPNTFDFAVNRQPLPGQEKGFTLLNNPGVTPLGKAGKVFQMAKEVYDRLPPETKSQLKQVINKQGNKVKDKFKFPGGNAKMEKKHSSGYALSKAPNPIETKLDTGIIPNAYTSDYLDAETNFCSPLHISGARISIPTIATSSLNMYFNKVIAFDLQTKAQANIGFNLNVNTDFTATKILNALNAIIEALSIYCYYMSIVSYHSDPSNKNEGMIFLRSDITSQMLEDLSVLGRRLADTPCPPNLVEFIRYFFGNYFTGNNQGSPMIKFVPFEPSQNMTGSAYITQAYDELALADNNQVYTLLRRSVPQWKIGPIKDVFPTPCYDENFKTIFSNMPFCYMTGSTGNRRPHAATTTETIAYNSFSNSLDGAAYACMSIYVTGSSSEDSWFPGLVKPAYNPTSTVFGNSRMSYYINSGTKGFYSPSLFKFLSRSRCETYYIDDANSTAIGNVHLFGSDRVKGVCQDTITETAYNVLDYLMSLDTIKTSMKSGFNPSTNKSRTRR